MRKTIKVKYFASLREAAAKDEEQISTEAHTAADLYEELKETYKFTLEAHQVGVAVDSQFGLITKEISDGDSIVFIPPVAGG